MVGKRKGEKGREEGIPTSLREIHNWLRGVDNGKLPLKVKQNHIR